MLEADDNQIETLEGLPPLPRLEEFSLCNNRILGGWRGQPLLCPRGQSKGWDSGGKDLSTPFSLTRPSGIQLPSDLRPLASFPKLSRLNLQGNPLCQIPHIHSQLTALLPKVATILT